jgi:SAM-dependent methyltransferase
MSLWADNHAATIDPNRFRAHNQYLEQAPAYPYDALARFVETHWSWMIEMMNEDDAFGCVTHRLADGRVVSRDLLDSCCEIGFLHDIHAIEWRMPSTVVLDIGAGYGRLAHRMLSVHPKTVANVVCTDAIEVSRKCCADYLTFRKVEGSRWAVIVPELVPHMSRVDLAVNIHSWSECSMAEVAGWLKVLAELNVPRLFIVPHEPTFGTYSHERGGGGGLSYLPEIARAGYRLAWKWEGPEVCPRTYALFERRRT